MSERWFPDAMPLPSASAETMPWWQAAREHQLVAQVCSSCAALRHPPGPICPECSSTKFGWRVLTGRGTVYTFTVVHQQFVPADVPYVVIAVEFPEGVRMVSNLVDADPADVRIGMPVEVVWEDMSSDLAVPRFRRVD